MVNDSLVRTFKILVMMEVELTSNFALMNNWPNYELFFSKVSPIGII